MNKLDIIMGMEESKMLLCQLQEEVKNEIKEEIGDILNINKYNFAIEVDKDRNVEPTLNVIMNLDRKSKIFKSEIKAIEELLDVKFRDMGESGFYDIRLILRFDRRK